MGNKSCYHFKSILKTETPEVAAAGCGSEVGTLKKAQPSHFVILEKTMTGELGLWERLSMGYQEYSLALMEFLSDEVDRVELMRSAFKGKDLFVGIHFLQYLKQDELISLFPELVFLASFSHGAVGTVRKHIQTLPREWILSNIESTAEPLLENGTYDEYRRFLELYIELDQDLALKLAQRAARHEDADIREAGEDFIRNAGSG